MAVEFSNDTDLISVKLPGQTQVIYVRVPGAQGPPGKFRVGSVVTGAPGTSANITTFDNAQGEQVVNFAIPRGDVGASNVLSIGTVNTGSVGSAAQASISGVSPSQILNLTIPQGLKGDKGDIGNTGPAGTITGVSATGLSSGSTPTVALGGTPSERTISFGIPAGATGATGPANVLTIGTVSTGASGSSAQATITGAAPNQVLNLTIPQGISGTTPPDATNTVKGSVQLAGDLGGTAAAPTVVNGTNHTHTVTQISNSTATGRSVLTAIDAAAARTAIGAGTSNLTIGASETTAAAGNHTHTAANISDSSAVGRAVMVAADASAARTAIEAGTSNLVIGTIAGTAADGAHVSATAAHGATGAVVGTTNTQTLTNKTLTGPIVSNYIQAPNSAAPANAPVGSVRYFHDSTTKRWQHKDEAGVLTRYSAFLGRYALANNVPVSSPGDTFEHDTTGVVFVWNDGAWRQASIISVADTTAMNSLRTSLGTLCHNGFSVWHNADLAVYMWQGTRWTIMGQDSGWLTLTTYSAGFTAGADAGFRYRKINGFVTIRAHVNRDTGTRNGVIATLPVGYRPENSVWSLAISSGNVVGEFKVNPIGTVELLSTGTQTSFVGFTSYPAILL